MITCQVCGKELKTITPAHLKTHWTTIAAYKILFPNSPLRDPEVCKMISNAHRGKPKSSEHRAKLAELNKARANDPMWVAMMTQAQRARRKREANLPLSEQCSE